MQRDLIRFCTGCVFLFGTSLVPSDACFSQNYSPAGPGYGNAPPTQAQIDADNKRFSRIRAGLPPDDESDVASATPKSTNTTTGNGSTPSGNAKASIRKSGDAGRNGKVAVTSNSTTRKTIPNIEAPRSRTLTLSSDGSISIDASLLNQPTESGSSTSPNKTFWSEGIQALAAISGKSIDLKNLPSGKFEIARLQGLSPAAARDSLNGILFEQGLTIVENGQKLIVLKLSQLKPDDVPQISLDELEKCLPNEFVRVEFPLRFLQAGPIALELSPLKSEFGHVSPIGPSGDWDTSGNAEFEDNEIRVVDSAQKVQQICKLIATAEQIAENASEERTLLVDHDNVANTRRQLLRLMELQQPTNEHTLASWISASPKTFNVQLTEAPQTNSLSAIALSSQITAMDAFLRFVNGKSDQSAYFVRDTKFTRVYPLRLVDPQTLFDLLSDSHEFKTPQKLRLDELNKALILDASWREHQLIADILRKFEPGERETEMIQLGSVSPIQVADTIQRAIAKNDRYPGGAPNKKLPAHAPEFQVRAVPDLNRIVISCTKIERLEIHEFLDRLGIWKDESNGWIRAFDPGPNPQQMVHRFLRLQFPVSTAIDSTGKVLLRSQDIPALDAASREFSDLLHDINGDRNIPMRFVSSFWIRMNLESVLFKEKLASETAPVEGYLSLDDDPISNTLIVRGATPEQMQTINCLVAVNDFQKQER